MKRFNTLVVVAWLAVFFCSLRSNSGGEVTSESFGLGWIMDNVNYQVNEFVWTNCQWCGKPSEEVRVNVGTDEKNQPVYAMQDQYGVVADNRLTATILQNTFLLLLAFMVALNVAFYCGNGTIGRLLKKPLAYIEQDRKAYLLRRSNKRTDTALRPPTETYETQKS